MFLKKRLVYKLISPILSVVLVLLPLSVLEPEDIYAANIVISGECGAVGNEANVTYQLDSDGLLMISGTGAMADYTIQNKSPWYDDKENVSSVVIDSGVSVIGEYAFYECSNMISIEMPENLLNIGNYAFSNCSKLQNVRVPEGITQINNYVFRGCSGLKTIEFFDELTSIGSYAFYGCSSLENIEFSDEITNIGSMAFYGCSSLESIKVPNKISIINTYNTKSSFEPIMLANEFIDESNIFTYSNVNLPLSSVNA